MTFETFHKRFPTAWENMVCNCGVCSGCKQVIKSKRALYNSFKETQIEIEKKIGERLCETFNNS